MSNEFEIFIFNALVESTDSRDLAKRQSRLDVETIRNAICPMDVIDQIANALDPDGENNLREYLIEAAQQDGISLAEKPDPRQTVLEL